MPVQKDGLVSIRNTGADALRASAWKLAAALAVALAAAAATAALLAPAPVHLRAWVVAIPGLAAAFCAAFLAQVAWEYSESPARIEYSAIIMMVRYRGGHFMGLSWAEITSIFRKERRTGPFGGPLFDLKLSVILKKDEVVRNLSLRTAHMLVAAWHQHAKKLPPEEAEKLADDMFDIKRYRGAGE